VSGPRLEGAAPPDTAENRAQPDAGLDRASLGKVHAVIFDVDGVLLDATVSYHAVAEEAARRAIAKLVGEEKARAVPFDRAVEVAAFKAAGRFNDDWEMARGIALLLYLRALGAAPSLAHFLESARGDGVLGLYRDRTFSDEVHAALDAQSIARTCGELYGGDRCRQLFGFDWTGEGYWQRETLLADATLLQQVARAYPLALFTGRNPGEARLALERTGLSIDDALCWVADGRPRKPDPAGLLWLTQALLKGATPGAQVLFVGDTADDQAAARAAQARGAPILYAHIAAPGDTARVLEKLLSGDTP
jgi:HAD superfamily phosphatase